MTQDTELRPPSNIELHRVATYLANVLPSNGFTFETQRQAFIRFVRQGNQRVGQAFMNVVDTDIHDALVGTGYDPFYSNDVEKVLEALDWATSKNPGRAFRSELFDKCPERSGPGHWTVRGICTFCGQPSKYI